MKRKQLLETTPCHIPQMDSEYVVAASQIVQIGTEEYLNIDLFYDGRRKARYFASVNERDWCVNIAGRWQKMKIQNVARAIMGKEVQKGYCWGIDDWKYASKRDREIAQEYIDAYSIESFETGVSWDKARKAEMRKADRIAEEMSIVDVVPDRAMQWLDEEIFPEEFLFVKDNGNTRHYACTKCGTHSWTKKKFKNYEKTVCPHCGAAVKVEKKADKKFRYANVIILQTIPQAIGSKWIERQFRAEAWWSESGKVIDMHENIRCIIPKGQNWGKIYYGEIKNADEFEQEWWDKNTNQRHFQQSFLYPYNLDEVMAYGNMQHSGIDILARTNTKFHVNKFIVEIGVRPWLEYLIKSRLTNLAVEVIEKWWEVSSAINKNGKNVKELLEIDGQRVNRMKALNGTLNTLKWLQYEEKHGIKITQESLEYVTKKKLDPDECSTILKELKSVNRMVNYMKKQKGVKDVLATWRDYLQMAAVEGYDMTDDIVRLPKNLKERHDALVEVITAKQNEEKKKKDEIKHRELNEKIAEHIPEIKKFFYENEKYIFIPAAKCEELIEEGQAMHHCVGASDLYMNKMAAGKTWIVFLRKKENVEKPYYTLEIDVKTNDIKQWYGKYDRKPDESVVRELLKEYKKEVNSKRKNIVSYGTQESSLMAAGA